MAKRSLFIVYCGLVFLPSLTFAAGALNGHEWRDLNRNSKGFYMLGLMEGYLSGHHQGITGIGGGANGVLRWIDEDLCRDQKQSVCTTIRDVIAGRESMTMKGIIVIGFKQNPPYYVQELDVFYEAFPLCRGKAVSDMLSQLIKIWASPKLEEISAEEIGRACGK